jgi:hypothetical protein
MVHHFFSREELRGYLRGFRIASLKEEFVSVGAGRVAHFHVRVTKP